jgi:hypothetical protein
VRADSSQRLCSCTAATLPPTYTSRQQVSPKASNMAMPTRPSGAPASPSPSIPDAPVDARGCARLLHRRSRPGVGPACFSRASMPSQSARSTTPLHILLDNKCHLRHAQWPCLPLFQKHVPMPSREFCFQLPTPLPIYTSRQQVSAKSCPFEALLLSLMPYIFGARSRRRSPLVSMNAGQYPLESSAKQYHRLVKINNWLIS